MVSETGSHPEIIGGAGEDLDHAQKEMERGYYAGAIFDSLQATTKASTMIGLLGKTDAQKKVDESYEAAKVAINEARLAGIEPTLAVSAYEYGETMTNPYEQDFPIFLCQDDRKDLNRAQIPFHSLQSNTC